MQAALAAAQRELSAVRSELQEALQRQPLIVPLSPGTSAHASISVHDSRSAVTASCNSCFEDVQLLLYSCMRDSTSQSGTQRHPASALLHCCCYTAGQASS